MMEEAGDDFDGVCLEASVVLFYDLTETADERFYSAHPSPHPKDLQDLFFARENPPTSIAYDIKYGREPGDILSCSPVYSTRLVDALNRAGATGFSTYPVKVTRAGKAVPGFVGIRVTGRGGPVDEARSKLVRAESGRIKSHTGIYMDEAGWDGSDVFSIPGMGIMIFVTERVANELNKLDLKNMELIRNDRCNFGRQPK
jgi:hypothetical protein